MESSKIMNLTVLNENNYPTWKIQVKMHLIKDNLFGIVDGSENAPTSTGDLVKYNMRRDRALAIIVLAINPKFLYIIGDPVDPKIVWQQLQDTFQKKTWANKLRLKRKLYNMKLEPGDSLQEHLKAFVELFSELAVIGDAINEEDRVINLLASLPDSFSTIVTALEAIDKVPSWESVTERLLHEEEKLNHGKNEFVENKSLVTRHNFKRSIKCFECGKLGHMKKDCRLFIQKCKRENYNSYSKNSNNMAVCNEITEDELILYASAFSANASRQWIIDSGATQHMCCDREMFTEFSQLSNPISVEVGDGRPLAATGEGKVTLSLQLPGDKVIKCTLEKVLYVPKLAHNLISVSHIVQSGKTTKFLAKYCEIRNSENKLVAIGSKIGSLYMLNCVSESVNFSKTSENETIWHRRFCHANYYNVRKVISNQLVNGIDCKITDEKIVCSECCDGKNHKLPMPKIDVHRNTAILDLIHTDVCGKIGPVSNGNGNYFLTFIDDASRYTWVYILKNKDEVFEKFKMWKSMVENQYEKKVKILRSDNGGEYTSNVFEKFLQSEGLVHEKTVVKTPSQNGVSERKNRTIMESVRSILSDSCLPKSFWDETVRTEVFKIGFLHLR